MRSVKCRVPGLFMERFFDPLGKVENIPFKAFTHPGSTDVLKAGSVIFKIKKAR